ncbi:hydroxyectoine utilization dehydratase EutB [Fulvimarina sp. 2208YS6-2-32]|uniref:Hydroxyectoine utilization dehydratase EutB n=1 Tax=Fulvimarina uroteuthidis TaxID=3098149 RepID=A0ABU5I0B5_9HYPH|nr:hydroxyectoine utilization dehydratase EutB [Fulvimarina sp. 2208YS6-2-32]MDY8108827.1 hydroxyectoine utilization dehydratase EutB [Fulvimarina sp. 2208YS6-2-32]
MGMVAFQEIEDAARRIRPHIRRTPVDLSTSLSDMTGVPVYLKLEHRQITGAFKVRGATNAVLSLSDAERARGVVAASTGNHGRGLAHAAKRAGIRCVVCMSSLVPQVKIDAIKALGAEIRIVGKSQDEAQMEVGRLIREERLVSVPPFDHPLIVAGQGTIGLEIVEDVPDVSTVFVPLSGGGLISGVAAAVKAKRPGVKVVGISMARGAAMHASLKAGYPTEVEELPTLADSLGGGINLDNSITFEMVRTLVDRVVLLTEAEIAAGIRHAYVQEREVIEGGAAVGVAALLARKVKSFGPTVLLLTGRSIDMRLHQSVVAGTNALMDAA